MQRLSTALYVSDLVTQFAKQLGVKALHYDSFEKVLAGEREPFYAKKSCQLLQAWRCTTMSRVSVAAAVPEGVDSPSTCVCIVYAGMHRLANALHPHVRDFFTQPPASWFITTRRCHGQGRAAGGRRRLGTSACEPY